VADDGRRVAGDDRWTHLVVGGQSKWIRTVLLENVTVAVVHTSYMSQSYEAVINIIGCASRFCVTKVTYRSHRGRVGKMRNTIFEQTS
jgi:hypothetical protein